MASAVPKKQKYISSLITKAFQNAMTPAKTELKSTIKYSIFDVFILEGMSFSKDH